MPSKSIQITSDKELVFFFVDKFFGSIEKASMKNLKRHQMSDIYEMDVKKRQLSKSCESLMF